MKKELLWSLPVAGISCWVLGYPFLERHTRADIRKNPALKGKDIETTKIACGKFKTHPTTIMNFVEGTRFSPAKREKQRAPYQHLLKPKSGGLALTLKETRGTLSGIINATIQYTGTPAGITFWQFACGDFDKIIVDYELLPITEDLLGDYYEDREFRKRFQSWINGIWEQKDQQFDA